MCYFILPHVHTHTHTQELEDREIILKNKEVFLQNRELILQEQIHLQNKAKEHLDKQLDEVEREKELLQERRQECEQLVRQLSLPREREEIDSSHRVQQPAAPPRVHTFKYKFLKGLFKHENRKQRNEGPLPSKSQPNLRPRTTHRLNSSPSHDSRAFKRSSLTTSLTTLDRQRTPSPDKRKSLPFVMGQGHKRHGSDELRYGGGGVYRLVSVCHQIVSTPTVPLEDTLHFVIDRITCIPYYDRDCRKTLFPSIPKFAYL